MPGTSFKSIIAATAVAAAMTAFSVTPVSAMNKQELIEAMAIEAGISRSQASGALDAFVEATAKALKKGDRVSLVGFGAFSVSKRAARTGRNPQTGKEIKISARKVIKFKAGKALSDAIN